MTYANLEQTLIEAGLPSGAAARYATLIESADLRAIPASLYETTLGQVTNHETARLSGECYSSHPNSESCTQLHAIWFDQQMGSPLVGMGVLVGLIGKVKTTGRPIEFDGQFYSADGFKFSKSYYEYLHKNGRPAPFLQAREILNNNPKVTPAPRGAKGYFRYEGAGLEMIYNPTTGQVGHIQPLR